MQINHDYANAKWNHHNPGNNLGAWIIILIIFMVGLVAMLAQSVRAAPIDQCNVIGATYDNLMSEDMAAYTVLYGHGREYQETDMQ